MSKKPRNRKQRTDGEGTCCPDLAGLLEPRFFRALGDASRLGILVGLAEERSPRTVGAIAACCTVDLSVVSRHLGMLRDAGIVTAEKRGKEVHYSVCCPEVADTLRTIADAIEACCPSPATGKGPATPKAKAKVSKRRKRKAATAGTSTPVYQSRDREGAVGAPSETPRRTRKKARRHKDK